MANVNGLARGLETTSNAVAKLTATTSKLASENARALASADKFSKSLTGIVTNATKALTSLEGLAGIAGGAFGGEAIRNVLQYNKSLYDLGKSASVTNRSFGEMRVAIKQLSSTTDLSEASAATLYKTINDGINGTRLSAQSTRELAKVMADEFGPSLQDTLRATQQLLDLNKKMPGTLAGVRSSLPYAEYQKMVEAQAALGKVTAQEAEHLLRSKKAYEGLKGATDKQADKYRELERVQAQLTKQFENFMLAVGKPLAEVLGSLGTAIAPFLDKLNKFLSDPKSQQFISILAKGALLKFGVDMASGPLQAIGKIKGAFGGGGGGSLASSLLGGAAPVPVVIVGDKTGGAGGGGFFGSAAGRGALIAGGAAGSYGLGMAADYFGRDTLAGGASSAGSYALGGASALGAFGPKAAGIGAVFMGVGEATTRLAKAFGFLEGKTESFGQTLSDVWTYLSEGKDGLRRQDIARNVGSERARRSSAIEKMNQQTIEASFNNLSDKDKKLLGIDKDPAKALDLFRQQVADTLAGGDLSSKVVTGAEIGGMASGARGRDRIGRLIEENSLREDILKTTEAEVGQLQTLMSYALQYGGSMEQVGKNASLVQEQLAEQTRVLSIQLDQAKQLVADRTKIANDKKGTEEEVSAQRGLQEALATQAALQDRINAQRQKAMAAQMQAISFAEAEIQADEKLLAYAARFGKGQAEISRYIADQSKMYDEQIKQLDTLISQSKSKLGGASPEDTKRIEGEINRLLATRTEILSKQADVRMNINVGLEAEKSTIMSSVDLAKSQLELSEALYGGFGATLEARSKIYNELDKAVKKTEEMILNQQKIVDANPKDQDALKKLNKLEQERVDLKKEQVNLTKALRDGYLDALTTFTNVEGTFSKIIATREANLGAAILKGFASGSMTLGVAGAGGTGPIAKFTPGGGLSLSNQAELDARRAGYEKAYGPGMKGSLAAGIGKGTFTEDVRTGPPGYGNFAAEKRAEQQQRDLARMRGLGTEVSPSPGGGAGVNVNINVKGEYAKKIVDEVSAMLTQKLNDLMNPHGSTGRTDDGTFQP